jgi:hypothetical protein
MQLIERKRPWRRAGWVMLCGLLCYLTGCGGGGGGVPSGGGTVSGSSVTGRVVVRSSSEPIANATVTVGNRSTHSGSDGRFSIAADPGTVTISVSATKFHTGTFSTIVEKGQPTDVGDLGLVDVDSGPPPPPF